MTVGQHACDDTEPVRLCSASDAGGCRLEGLGASGGLERLQPIVCMHCQHPGLGPCLGCSWGGPGQSNAMPRCEAGQSPSKDDHD